MSRFNCGCLVALLVGGLSAANLTPARGDTGQTNDSVRHGRLIQGDAVGVFYVTKVAGAEDDGVQPGEDLCYRCRYGSCPMVMVFARRTGGRFTGLVKQIDAAVSANQEFRLKGLVTLLGESSSELKEAAIQVAEETAVTHVPVVIAKEFKTGPLNYKLPSDAAITVVVAKDSQVVSTHTFTVEEIDIAAVMNEVNQILN